MDLNIFKLGNGQPMSSSPTIGLPMLWIADEVKNMTEDEFWNWIVDLNNNWYNEEQKQSISKRAAINKNLIPSDFDATLKICLSIIFTQSQKSWKSRGLNPIPR